MNNITTEYKKDNTWRLPHKYSIHFNDGKSECGWWMTVSSKEEMYYGFDLSVGIDVAEAHLPVTLNFEKYKQAVEEGNPDIKNEIKKLSHRDVVELITRDLTRDIAFGWKEYNEEKDERSNYWIFAYDNLVSHAYVNFVIEQGYASTIEELIEDKFLGSFIGSKYKAHTIKNSKKYAKTVQGLRSAITDSGLDYGENCFDESVCIREEMDFYLLIDELKDKFPNINTSKMQEHFEKHNWIYISVKDLIELKFVSERKK